MSKKAKLLIVLIVMVIVLLGAFFLIKYLIDQNEKKPEQIRVSQTAVADIVGLTYQSDSTEGKKVSLIREDGIWYYEDDKQFPLDQEYVTNTMVLSASEATANKKVENPSKDLSEYGLDKPSVTITLKKITGDTLTMHIGDYNEGVTGYYLKLEDSDEIYLVDGKMVFAFDMSIHEIAKIEKYPYVEESSCTHISMEKDNTIIELRGKVEEDAASTLTSNYYVEQEKTWKWSKNGTVYKTGDQAAIKEFLTQLCGLKFDSMITYRSGADEKAKYGVDSEHGMKLTVDYQVFDETTARIEEVEPGISQTVMDTVDKQYILYIGYEKTDDSYGEDCYYVRLEGSDIIYTMDTESLEKIVAMDVSQFQK